MSVQDPFSEVSDPAFHSKRGPGPSGAPYLQGGGPTDPSVRIQYDANKDLYGVRKGQNQKRMSFFVIVDWLISLQSLFCAKTFRSLSKAKIRLYQSAVIKYKQPATKRFVFLCFTMTKLMCKVKA